MEESLTFKRGIDIPKETPRFANNALIKKRVELENQLKSIKKEIEKISKKIEKAKRKDELQNVLVLKQEIYNELQNELNKLK